jgi:hypothetical protein
VIHLLNLHMYISSENVRIFDLFALQRPSPTGNANLSSSSMYLVADVSRGKVDKSCESAAREGQEVRKAQISVGLR